VFTQDGAASLDQCEGTIGLHLSRYWPASSLFVLELPYRGRYRNTTLV